MKMELKASSKAVKNKIASYVNTRVRQGTSFINLNSLSTELIPRSQKGHIVKDNFTPFDHQQISERPPPSKQTEKPP